MSARERRENGIAWLEAGSGEPLLLLHGMPGSSHSWSPQFAAFSGKFRTIAWDMPGYGGSPALPGIATPEAMADHLAGIVTGRFGEASVHLMGLSLGGMIALHLARRHPKLVRSLCILDASPKFGFGAPSDPEEFVASVAMPLTSGTAVADFCGAVLYDLMAPNCAAGVRQAALTSMARASTAGLVAAARMISNHDITTDLRDIEHPAIVMTGEFDTATPPSYGMAIANAMPNARFHLVPRAGHLSNLENSEVVNATYAAFQADLP